MITYRGYEIKKGLCGGIGIFVAADGYQSDTVDTEEEAKAKIDGWHAHWREMIEQNCDDAMAQACREAIEACGETI